MNRPAPRPPRALATAALSLACVAVGGPASGAGAHVHGEGRLDVAVEAGRVDLFLQAPLGDLRGDGAADAAALEARFGRADRFTLSGAGCRLASHSAEIAPVFAEDWSNGAAADDPDHAEGHEHDGDHAADHEHGDDHAEGHEHDGDHAEDHEHGDDHSGHSDGYLSWTYRCEGDP